MVVAGADDAGLATLQLKINLRCTVGPASRCGDAGAIRQKRVHQDGGNRRGAERDPRVHRLSPAVGDEVIATVTARPSYELEPLVRHGFTTNAQLFEQLLQVRPD